jgi:hypothetical protein
VGKTMPFLPIWECFVPIKMVIFFVLPTWMGFSRIRASNVVMQWDFMGIQRGNSLLGDAVEVTFMAAIMVSSNPHVCWGPWGHSHYGECCIRFKLELHWAMFSMCLEPTLEISTIWVQKEKSCWLLMSVTRKFGEYLYTVAWDYKPTSHWLHTL